MLLGAMPEESGPAAALVTKTRATDFSIAAIMARGQNRKQQSCRASVNNANPESGTRVYSFFIIFNGYYPHLIFNGQNFLKYMLRIIIAYDNKNIIKYLMHFC